MTSAPRTSWIKPDEYVIVGLTALWLLSWRYILETPWGFAPVPAGDGLVNVGIICNPIDTWSYLSWVQQYSHGANFAGLLYTTEPHAPLLWLFPLWLIGKVAAWTGLSVIGTYNGAGFFGAILAVFFFLRAAAALQLSPSARHWAAVAFVLGSGGSWLWHLAHKFGWASAANGGDLYFLDLFPSTALIAYAFHTLGLTLLAALWWTTTTLESRRLAREPIVAWGVATAGIALLLGFSRPYEPLSFLGAWFLKTAWHILQRRNAPADWRNSATIGALLFLALAPGIGWTLWVSTQPIWSTFSHAAMTLNLARTAWVWTLGGWFILVAFGIGPVWRANARLAVLPLAASFLFALILLGPGAAHTKLASGLILGPLLLSGWGAARLVAATARLPGLIRIGAMSLGLSALLGLASLFMVLHAMKLHGPGLVDIGLITLAGRLPVAQGAPPPVVLTDAATGGVLPGLAGARVWVGHWGLSNHYAAKVARLQKAGLDPAKPNVSPSEIGAPLEEILAETRFDYALLDRRSAQAIHELGRHGWHSLATTARWDLLQAPRRASP